MPQRMSPILKYTREIAALDRAQFASDRHLRRCPTCRRGSLVLCMVFQRLKNRERERWITLHGNDRSWRFSQAAD